MSARMPAPSGWGDRIGEGSHDKPTAYLDYRLAQEGFWLSKMKNF